MLLEAGLLEDLEKYIQEKNDKQLNKWWAQYLESNNRLDVAAKYYKLSEDYNSLVRLFLAKNDFQKAR